MSKPYYLTTTLPYVNADPHIGFALEIVQADILARYHALLGDEVFFNTGTDEHGIKIYRKAQEEGKEPQAYVDEYAAKFQRLKEKLNLFPELHFIRTTDAKHKAAAQEFWRRCLANGDIYKKNYQIKYCVGCELEKTDSELVNGRCPIHPNLDLEIIDEENYFFRFSKYQKSLLDLYARRPDFVLPDFRFNEIRAFVARGLEDFSISRVKEKMPWGVPVPDNDAQVMYVWFDALINYISTLGWPEDNATFKKFWGTDHSPNAIQLAGKDQIRQQAAMWQAMLLSAELPSTKQVVIHGFITVNGQKMSKSLGNVIDPIAIVNEYGADALRLFLARHIHPFEDSDFTMEKFKESYNADLANGLGNQVARIMRLAADNLSSPVSISEEQKTLQPPFKVHLDAYNYNAACDLIWEHIAKADAYIQEKKPFALVKSKDEAQKKEGIQIIEKLVGHVAMLATHLEPIIPETAAKMRKAVETNTMPEALFPRKDERVSSSGEVPHFALPQKKKKKRAGEFGFF
ncbi:methionine--tRNA ligase [Candidatus Kaiserbacteria bacterium RIFCSPLOWO2_01_FULL_53_17]|uniref:Methionine--tRNA ligase n=1 Tax=Candidatus Kaiserbacteria bacterium RIFCSPLOWO2_01_FULL_53_17 TaxID=1798511 RepID=A0A1F6EHX6_9BACT|nr:MAG: methionine--tRNA ligase [Candidatus Kaiserbacteria bacterium RIFCSPLOWO2_01_FULL_53_17]